MGGYLTKIKCSRCDEEQPRYKMRYDTFPDTMAKLAGIKMTQEMKDQSALCPVCDAAEQKMEREIQERAYLL